MTMASDLRLRVNHSRLMARLFALADIGAIDGGGCSRLALTDEEKAGRDLVMGWMKELGLAVSIDVVGNVIGVWEVGQGDPIMTGSHIDTVRTGGKYDGNYGVLAGLEVIQTCQENNIAPSRPLAVGFFSNEEGARYAPDMFGSLTYVGGLSTQVAHDTVGIDGTRFGDELQRIGYQGETPCPGPSPAAFVELHIEQGPILENSHVTIGVVTGVQGISWQEVTITGQSNHAGTTPMNLRHDPSYVVASVTVFLRELAQRYSGHQVCTVGKVDLFPNLINVIPAKAMLTIDVRNTDESLLQAAEKEIDLFLHQLAQQEGVTITARKLARYEPVSFHREIISVIQQVTESLDYTHMHLPSGAGHDAQMLARVCPSGMIFVPSINGISHNPAEDTASQDLEAGANVLLHAMLELAESISL